MWTWLGVIFLVLGAWRAVGRRLVPNGLWVGMLSASAAACLLGAHPWSNLLAGTGLGLCLGLPLGLLGWLRGPEVKAMVCSGALLGPVGLCWMLGLSVLAGLVWALVRAARRGQAGLLLLRLKLTVSVPGLAAAEAGALSPLVPMAIGQVVVAVALLL